MRLSIYIPILVIVALALAMVVHVGIKEHFVPDSTVYNNLYYNSGLAVRNEQDKTIVQDMYPQEVLDTIALLNNTAKVSFDSKNKGNPYDLLDEALEKFSSLRRVKMTPDTQKILANDLPYGPAQYIRLDNIELYHVVTKRIIRLSYVDITVGKQEVTFNFALSYPFKKPMTLPSVVPATLFGTSGPMQLRNTFGLFSPYATSMTENHIYKEDLVEYQKQVDANTLLIRQMSN